MIGNGGVLPNIHQTLLKRRGCNNGIAWWTLIYGFLSTDAWYICAMEEEIILSWVHKSQLRNLIDLSRTQRSFE
jgi:hypothetical protein